MEPGGDHENQESGLAKSSSSLSPPPQEPYSEAVNQDNERRDPPSSLSTQPQQPNPESENPDNERLTPSQQDPSAPAQWHPGSTLQDGTPSSTGSGSSRRVCNNKIFRFIYHADRIEIQQPCLQATCPSCRRYYPHLVVDEAEIARQAFERGSEVPRRDGNGGADTEGRSPRDDETGGNRARKTLRRDDDSDRDVLTLRLPSPSYPALFSKSPRLRHRVALKFGSTEGRTLFEQVVRTQRRKERQRLKLRLRFRSHEGREQFRRVARLTDPGYRSRVKKLRFRSQRGKETFRRFAKDVNIGKRRRVESLRFGSVTGKESFRRLVESMENRRLVIIMEKPSRR